MGSQSFRSPARDTVSLVPARCQRRLRAVLHRCGARSCLRTRNRLVRAQVTNRPFAFLSSPRWRTFTNAPLGLDNPSQNQRPQRGRGWHRGTGSHARQSGGLAQFSLPGGKSVIRATGRVVNAGPPGPSRWNVSQSNEPTWKGRLPNATASEVARRINVETHCSLFSGARALATA